MALRKTSRLNNDLNTYAEYVKPPQHAYWGSQRGPQYLPTPIFFVESIDL